MNWKTRSGKYGVMMIKRGWVGYDYCNESFCRKGVLQICLNL